MRLYKTRMPVLACFQAPDQAGYDVNLSDSYCALLFGSSSITGHSSADGKQAKSPKIGLIVPDDLAAGRPTAVKVGSRRGRASFQDLKKREPKDFVTTTPKKYVAVRTRIANRKLVRDVHFKALNY